MNLARLLGAVVLSILCLCIPVVSQESQLQPLNPTSAATPKTSASPVASEMDEVKHQLREQQQEIERLRIMLAEQAKIIEKIQNREAQPISTANSTASNAANAAVSQQTESVEKRLEKVEAATKKTTDDIAGNRLGSFGFSGDLRVQYDSMYNQINNAPNINNPAILGNELNSRHRGRLRLRFAIRGKLGGDVFTGAYAANGEKRLDKEFDWGFRFSTGSLAEPISTNQVLTDFYNRKQFALDQAFVTWRPRPLPGLRITAGKFDPNWTRTEMTIDGDVQVEGLGETYSRDVKNSVFKNFTLSAWQLPMLERNATFVRNANGMVNFAESLRAGRDLGLFGAQAQARLAFSKTNLTLSAANLHFAGTEAINPILVFGNLLQLPVTVTIPASGATPAQTVTGVAMISRDLLIAGNGNLGLTSATNAAINRNGRLASGFNLVDLIARLDFNQFRHTPVSLIFNYIRNTQTRDVIVADAAGNDRILPNNENDGVWAEIQFRSLRKNRAADRFDEPVQGDILFGYTFMQIEKDAVLTPFNLSDLAQQSDTRAHRLAFTYFAHPRVTFNFTGIFNHRLHGLLGPFANTPVGSLNNDVVRLQFDTVYRF